MLLNGICICDACAAKIDTPYLVINMCQNDNVASEVSSRMLNFKMSLLLAKREFINNIEYFNCLEQNELHFCTECCSSRSYIHKFQYDTFLSRMTILNQVFK